MWWITPKNGDRRGYLGHKQKFTKYFLYDRLSLYFPSDLTKRLEGFLFLRKYKKYIKKEGLK